MLCVEGQALAVLEDLEELKGTTQKFTDIVTKLQSAREGKWRLLKLDTNIFI